MNTASSNRSLLSLCPSRSTYFRTAALFSVLLSVPPLAANPIADNPFFQQLVGKWEGEGQLVNSDDGSITPVKESWKGEFTEGGNFVMSGHRTLDQNEHDFSWEYFANDDLIEGQMKMSEPEVDARFEAQVSDADRTITLKVELSGGGGIMTITNTVSEDGLTIEGTVELVDDTGKTTTTGTVTHRKA